MIERVYTGTQIKKPVRTISGVTPLTVVLKPRKCDHGTCIFCPGGDYVPQSYTNKSPAIMRASALKYDPYEQTKVRLKTLKAMNHPVDKIEIILLGGTFLQYDVDYQYWFVKRIFDALNEQDSETLEIAQKINEKAKHRCVAMCIENRPDNCSEEEIVRMREFGATRVELGVQILDDEIYRRINRGHKIKDVIEASKKLRDAGFKIGYHIMPGLPYSSYEKDMESFNRLFNDENFRPDQLKIYPCQVVEDSPLAKIHEVIKYKPYNEEETKKILLEMMQAIPSYCRVMRMMREFPKEKLIKGVEKLDLRKDVETDLKNSGIKVKGIRMREVGFNLKTSSKLGQSGEIGFNQDNLDLDLNIKITEYNASGGKEFFIEAVNNDDILFGLLRLRLTNETFLKELKDCALIRELHVYGQALKLGQKGKESQHTGIGKQLMKLAEDIAKKEGYKKIAVISGVGVREYYRKLGYELEGSYMIKKLLNSVRNT